MEPLTLIAGMALLLGGAFYVCYPFFAPQQGPTLSAGQRGQRLQERKEQLYVAIKELEFDQELGKLSADDYQRMRRQLEGEALAVIQQLDQLNGHADPDDLLQQLEREVSARRQAPTTSEAECCPSCRTERRPDDLFCSRCGTRFEPQEN